MKKSYFFKFFVFALVGALVLLPSCKDYDDDISNLESQLSSLKGTVDQIDAAVKDGSVISNVASTDGGITITLSNGQSYPITNGANGANGADGSVVTIGENGNWFIDGVDTELAARGPQGETGAPGTAGKDGVDGKDGAPGADGKDGAYYYPNEDGFWWKVDGETEMATDMSWLPAGTITAVWDDDAQTVTLYNVEGADGPIPFGNVAIVSLHLIPDYVMPTGSLPMIVFQSLVTEDCGNISAPVVARFRVSPSNASVNAINTKDLAFLYNDPTVFDVYRSAEIAPVATFKSLENGILEVYVDINTAKLEDLYESDKMDNLQLEVPLKNGSKVYSDWMGVTSQEFDEIMLVNVQNDPEDAFDDYAFTTNLLDETVGLEIDDLPVVHIKYDNTFDLIDVVQTMIVDPEMELDTDAYGLTYKFDLLDEEGEVIEYIETANNTDQQDFISLLDGDKGTVKSKVFSQQDSRTAIGRTPIVRVRLMNDDCVVYTAFIKINWTEDEPVPPVPHDVELAKTVKFDCGELTVTSTVQWMNEEIYSALGLTKQEFHASYTLAEGVYDADGELDETLGSVEELVDLDTGLTTNLFVWTFQPEADNNVVTGYIHYLQGTRVAVKVKVTATVTMPTLSLHGYNTTYWNAARNLFTVNPIVYDNDEAGDDVNIYADLLRGFLNEDGIYSMNEADIVKSTGAVPATVTFQFDETKLANYKYFIGSVEYSKAKNNLSISPDGTQLLLGGKVAATIKNDSNNGYKIYLHTDGTQATDEAKALIGKRVPVKIVTDLCGDGEFVQTLKSYEVFFIEPIKINAEIDGSFEDAVIGGSRIGIGEGLTFTDWNNYAVRAEAYDNPTEKQKHAVELYEYYVITDAVWNVEDATSNLKQVNGDRVPTEGYTEGPVTELGYRITHDSGTNELVFWNDEGVKLMEPFVIYVPVTVGHKWGSTSQIVEITVNPTQ